MEFFTQGSMAEIGARKWLCKILFLSLRMLDYHSENVFAFEIASLAYGRGFGCKINLIMICRLVEGKGFSVLVSWCLSVLRNPA